MGLLARIAALKPLGADVNCFGTAFYLCGLKEQETFVEYPELGMLVVFVGADYSMPRQGVYLHIGVITGLEPLRMAHRRNYEGAPVFDEEVMAYRNQNPSLRGAFLIFASAKPSDNEPAS